MRQTSKIDTVSVSEDEPTVAEIVGALEFDILFGELRPRERLVEDAIMQRFSTKRNVVRRAFSELERMGIVVRAPNRGASVRDLTRQEVEEITELRETLHRRAVQRMPLPAAPELVKRLQSIQRKHDKAVKAHDPRAIVAANEKFHAIFFAACGNKLLEEAITNYSYLSRIMRLYPMVDSEMLAQLRQEHWAMIDASKRGDRKALMKLVVDHIQHSKRMYLLLHGPIVD